MDRTKQKWEEFRLRHRELFRRINREIPGFWAEVAELGRTHYEETVTTRGAVVRNFPETREIGTQTSDDRGPGREGSRNVGADKACQTPSTKVSLAALEAAADRELPGERREGRSRERRAAEQRMPFRGPEARRPTGRGSPNRRATDCWNCGGRDHRYAACPRPRRGDFCYRCGEEDVTLRGCPRCQNAWREEGPYRPRRASGTREQAGRGE